VENVVETLLGTILFQKPNKDSGEEFPEDISVQTTALIEVVATPTCAHICCLFSIGSKPETHARCRFRGRRNGHISVIRSPGTALRLYQANPFAVSAGLYRGPAQAPRRNDLRC